MSLLRRWDFWLFLASVVLFAIWPRLDLAVADWYYDPDAGFLYRSEGWVYVVYKVFAHIHLWVLALLGWLWFASWHWARKGEVQLRRRLSFLLLVLVLGPGLLVNVVFKGEWGRARPVTVQELGGERLYTPPGVISDQCERNCSFVSGHAAMGFYPLALAWVFGLRRWLLVGVLLGGVVGAGRMMQGGHFFSDVIFAGWTVYGTALLCAWWLLGRTLVRVRGEVA
jgi:lipid A 4'-phosphatase